MKVSPSNQTLILANDGPPGGKPSGLAGQSSRGASSGGDTTAVLQRVTVVTSLPDSTVVYVHADYATRGKDADRTVASQTPDTSASGKDLGPHRAELPETAAATAGSASLVELSAPAYNRLLRASNVARDSSGNPHSSNENVGLYARTERSNGALRPSLVDVHA